MKTFSLNQKILICTVLCLVLGIASGISTGSSIGTWYADLRKPFFNPPNWIFGPAWTLLYILMGTATALVWDTTQNALSEANNSNLYLKGKQAIYLFIVQFAVNLCWTPLFFGFQQIGWALVLIVILLALILATFKAYKNVKPIAAYLLVPYLLWVSFATCLNAAIWLLN